MTVQVPLAPFFISITRASGSGFEAAYAMLVRREGPGGSYCPEVLVPEPEFPCVLSSFWAFLLRPGMLDTIPP